MVVQNQEGNTPPYSESKNSSALSVWRLILDTNSSKIDKSSTGHTWHITLTYCTLRDNKNKCHLKIKVEAQE
jgi:hypothetical protein